MPAKFRKIFILYITENKEIKILFLELVEI